MNRNTSVHSRRLLAAGAVAAAALSLAPNVAQAASAPVTWQFDKCAVSAGVWEGTASSGDVTVGLRTQLTSARASGTILHVGFDWYVGDVYLATMTGTLNQSTGAVVMNGVVADGAYAGSQVHEEGQLYDAQRGCFAGTIQILPTTS